MICYKHNERNGINTCNKCGVWLCSECTIEIDNRIVCKECIKKHMGSHDIINSTDAGYRYSHKPIPNSFLSILFSLIFPGAGLMYLGLIKRGLFFTTLFFGTIYVSTLIGMFGIFIPAIFVTSVFISYQTCQKIIQGEIIEDNVDDVQMWFEKHKSSVFIVGLAIIGFKLISGFFRGLNYYFPHASIIVFGIICYLAYNYFFKTKNDKDGNN